MLQKSSKIDMFKTGAKFTVGYVVGIILYGVVIFFLISSLLSGHKLVESSKKKENDDALALKIGGYAIMVITSVLLSLIILGMIISFSLKQRNQ